MSNVIRFLETLGREARWSDISRESMESALDDAAIENPLRSAILDKDAARLQWLLHRKTPVGYVIPGEEDTDEQEDEQENEHEAGCLQACRPSSFASAARQ